MIRFLTLVVFAISAVLLALVMGGSDYPGVIMLTGMVGAVAVVVMWLGSGNRVNS